MQANTYPVIETHGRHTRDVTADAVSVLLAQNEYHPQLYRRQGRIYRKKNGCYYRAKHSDLRYILARSADFMSSASGTQHPVTPDGAQLSDILVQLRFERLPLVPDNAETGDEN